MIFVFLFLVTSPLWRPLGPSMSLQFHSFLLKMLTLKTSVIKSPPQDVWKLFRSWRRQGPTSFLYSERCSPTNILILVQWYWLQTPGLQDCERIQVYCLSHHICSNRSNRKHSGCDCSWTWVMKCSGNRIVVMVAQLSEYPQNHWSVHSKWVNFMLCELYLNKTVKKIFVTLG